MSTGRFETRINAQSAQLSLTEQRLARAIVLQKDRVVLASAQQIAELAGTSDATLLRMMRALGYETLAEMREELLADLTGGTAPSLRMQLTMDEAGSDPARLLAHVIGIQQDHLAALRAPALSVAFGQALNLLTAAAAAHVFGLGPSGAMADYLALQLCRVGLPARAMTQSGIGLAEKLLAMQAGDLLVLIAYAPLYREVRVALERAEALGLPVVLISDSLGPVLQDRITVTLDVPRGRSEHLALHSATLVMIEALVLGVSAQSRDRALDALDDFASLRAAIDSSWTKRGTRRRKTTDIPPAAEMPPSHHSG
ncbi:MAG: MurR/RpiR family transcriptional regulator [Alphaproteobacteria bacterium]